MMGFEVSKPILLQMQRRIENYCRSALNRWVYKINCFNWGVSSRTLSENVYFYKQNVKLLRSQGAIPIKESLPIME